MRGDGAVEDARRRPTRNINQGRIAGAKAPFT
jgi:hypothetical protein